MKTGVYLFLLAVLYLTACESQLATNLEGDEDTGYEETVAVEDTADEDTGAAAVEGYEPCSLFNVYNGDDGSGSGLVDESLLVPYYPESDVHKLGPKRSWNKLTVHTPTTPGASCNPNGPNPKYPVLMSFSGGIQSEPFFNYDDPNTCNDNPPGCGPIVGSAGFWASKGYVYIGVGTRRSMKMCPGTADIDVDGDGVPEDTSLRLWYEKGCSSAHCKPAAITQDGTLKPEHPSYQFTVSDLLQACGVSDQVELAPTAPDPLDGESGPRITKKQARWAVQFIRYNADAFGIDPDRIYMLSKSAGTIPAQGAAYGTDAQGLATLAHKSQIETPTYINTSSRPNGIIGGSITRDFTYGSGDYSGSTAIWDPWYSSLSELRQCANGELDCRAENTAKRIAAKRLLLDLSPHIYLEQSVTDPEVGLVEPDAQMIPTYLYGSAKTLGAPGFETQATIDAWYDCFTNQDVDELAGAACTEATNVHSVCHVARFATRLKQLGYTFDFDNASCADFTLRDYADGIDWEDMDIWLQSLPACLGDGDL